MSDEFDAVLRAERGGVGMPRIRNPRRHNRLGAAVKPRYVGARVDNVEDFEEETVEVAPERYTAAENSYFAFSQAIAAGATNFRFTVQPERPVGVIRFNVPSTTLGLVINQIFISGTQVFANSAGVPVEMFSEVSTIPNIDWMTIQTTPGVTFEVSELDGVAKTLRGTFYGTIARV